MSMSIRSGGEVCFGVCRSKTRQFVQYRSTYTRRGKSGGVKASRWNDDMPSGDDIALVEHEVDLEGDRTVNLPPEWIDTIDEIRFNMSNMQQRLKELSALHDKHLNRPDLDDSSEQEAAIEILTGEITRMFQNSQMDIKALQNKGRESRTPGDAKTCQNAALSLAQELQAASQLFRDGQRSYLLRIRKREEKKRQFFGVGDEEEGGIGEIGGVYLDNDDNLDNDIYDKQFTQGQLLELDQDTALIEQRNREVLGVVQSIKELGDIFRELSTMVIDQGTMLDRIDYNLETVNVTVSEGLVQLQEGEKYQKKGRRKLACILVLVLLILVFIILIALK